MKRSVILVSAVLLFAGLAFAQTPQTQEKNTKSAPAKKECSQKNTKACADKKDAKCCAHSPEAKKSCTDKKEPEKK